MCCLQSPRPRARAHGSKPSTTSLKKAPLTESPSIVTAACRWRLRSTRCTRRHRPIFGISSPTLRATFTLPLARPRECIRSRPMAKPASFSLPRNCRYRRLQLTVTARSTLLPHPMARFTRSCGAEVLLRKRWSPRKTAESHLSPAKWRGLRLPSILPTAPLCFSIRSRNTSGRSRSISRDVSTSAPAIMAKSSAWNRTAPARYFSRAMRPRFACSTSTNRAT